MYDYHDFLTALTKCEKACNHSKTVISNDANLECEIVY